MIDLEASNRDARLAKLGELADAATAAYDLPAGLELTLLNLSENATYRVDARDGRRWALRVHREGYHSNTAIASELAWLVDLRRTGVAITPSPVAGRDGALIQQAAHWQLKGPRNVVLFEWEQGAEPGIGDDLGKAFESLGEVTARMHLHARQWKPPSWFTRFKWDFETSIGGAQPHWGRWQDGMDVDANRKKHFKRAVNLIGRRLAAYGKNPDRFGLVHCDLRLANLLIDGNTVKVIDFDDCGFGWHMYDAATPVSFYEHEPQVPGLIESWKTGYRRVAALSRADEGEIPTFVMLRRLLLVAWIGSHADTDLARAMGHSYTEGTDALCEAYLMKFG